jgi:prepilin-type N-terminal cleavage/methylation domain-containing protein
MRKGSAGFTLIELLIGIIIVGILAAIGVPAYLGFVQRARETAVMYYLREVHKGQQEWRLETDSQGYTGDFEELEKSGFIPDSVNNTRIRVQSPRRDWSVEMSVRRLQTYELQMLAYDLSGTRAYYIYAYPQNRSTRVRWFYIDQTGVIRAAPGWAGPGAPPAS